MEDLYGNLDNYNEVNALEELRSENEELKVKLEEYATAMEKLQKEFDTVSSEYKKLEHNYSSLLKTAKAEIERKTQIITNMNIEKDMLVLSALQNGNRSILKAKQFVPNTMHNFKKNNNGAHKKNAKMQENQNKKNDTLKERVQEHHMPSDDIMRKENTQEITSGHKPAPNPDSRNDRTSSATDNIKNENHVKSGPAFPMSVKQRRKSNIGYEKLSSDELGDGLAGGSKYDHPARYKEDRKSFTKNHNEKYIGKGLETGSMDDKFSPHLDSSRETFKTRPGKYYNGDKHRSRERNDNSLRYKRYHSPERYNKKPRDYDEHDYNQRPEFSRSRGRESPSNDRFHHHSYKEHRQYEKYNLNEQDRYIHGQEKYVAKHKTPHDYDEPNRKRQKTESYGKLKEDGRWHDRELFKVQELTETFERLEEQYTSCQSPDHISYETAPELIKVIRNTAETQLEDPRLATNKYILNNDNGLVTLSTVNSKHVNIIPIDKKNWGMQKMSMPDALVQLPPQDQLIKDLYADIDTDQRNMLTEKSEIGINVQNATSEHTTKDIPDNSNFSEDTSNRTSATQNIKEKVDKPAPGLLSSYKIPKIKRSIKDNKSDLKERSLDNIESLCIAHDKDLKYRLIRNRSKSPFDKHDNNDAESESVIHTVSQNDMNLQVSERVFSTREIVEGDLELSDETCDNTELQKTMTQNTNEHDSNDFQKSNLLHTEVEDIPNNPTIHNNQVKETDCVTATNFQNQKLHAPEEIITQHEKTEELVEVHKKHKSKRKTHKHRDSEHSEVSDKKLKAKKDKKEKPKEVKTKFNDLFGDSTSLITPDDLGIPVTNVPNPSQLTLNYVPIFEDALDATDLEQTTNITTPIIPQTKDNDNAPALVPVSVGNNGKINVIESISKLNETSKDSPKLESHNGLTVNESAPTINTAEDLNLENCNKSSDIVATIIISTGVQPDEINSESRAESLVNAEELLADNIEQDQNYETNKHQDLLIKALATSTPHKQMVQQIALEIDEKQPEPSCDSNSRIANIDNTSNTNNTTQPNEDLPDVRIFVKRRRRLVKPAK